MHKYIKHEPRNSKPETRNSKPETRNPRPETRDPKLETFSRNSGMTLIEVMFASLIGSILVLAFYSAMDYQSKANAVQDQVTKAQENLRVAMGMIERDLRMAGYGLNEQITFTGGQQAIYPCNGCGDGTGTAAPASRSDSIIIWSNFGDKKLYASAAVPALQAIVNVGTDPINGNDATIYFKKNDYLLIKDITDSTKFEAKLITNVAASQLTVSTAFTKSYLQFSEVRDIKSHAYAIDSNGNLTLTLVTNTTSGATSSPVLAENIEDLQFAYGMDANADGNFDGTWYNYPGTLSGVIAARVTIVARTALEDKTWARAGKTPPFFRPGVEDRTAATATDGFRRRILEKIVYIRNVGLANKYKPVSP